MHVESNTKHYLKWQSVKYLKFNFIISLDIQI